MAKKTCKIKGCVVEVSKDDLCAGHYFNEKHGSLPSRDTIAETKCSGCGKKASEVKLFIKKHGKCSNCVAKDKRETSGSTTLPGKGAKKASTKPLKKSRGSKGGDVAAASLPSTTASSSEEGIKGSGIAEICDELKAMLLEKNRLYGNSALNPIRAFSKADRKEQLNVRIDDKISRLISGQLDDKEDVIKDLIGYLILLLVAQRNG